MARIKDVARHSGVSISSVSRYFNAPETLQPETRRKVQEAVEALHYTPSPIARSLRTRSTDTIAFIIPTLTNLYYVDLYSEVHAAAAARGYTVNLMITNSDRDLLRKFLSTLAAHNMDGAIIAFLDSDDLLDDIRAIQESMPVVLVTSIPDRQEFNSVFVDAMMGIMKATQHLVDMGCGSLAFVGSQKNGLTLEKLRGFESCMNQNRLPMNPDFFFFDKNHFTTGFWAMRQFLTLSDIPDGIVCATDDIAMGCVKYLLHSGRRVPQDVRVIGFNGISLINAYEPSISSMRHPVKQMAAEAMELLHNSIWHPKSKRQQIALNTSLVVNTSTDPDAPERFSVWE